MNAALQSKLCALEAACRERGLRMTGQRKLVAEVLLEAEDHPDAATLLARVRARAKGKSISEATLYRSLKFLEETKLAARRDFGDGRARFEITGPHHDHLIDIETGAVVEFYDEELERLQEKIAKRLGYTIVDHRMELFGKKRPPSKSKPKPKAKKP